MEHRRLVVLHAGRPFIDVEHMCDVLGIDDDRFCRISMDPGSPSVTLTRVGGQLFIESSCCRILLTAWMPEKVRHFDHIFTSTGTARRTLTAAEKKTVAMRQEWKCKHCNNVLRDFEVDHVEQHCIRNQDSWLQALCPGCHREKTREDRMFGDALFEARPANLGPKTSPIKIGTANIFSDYMLAT
jgi:phage FluMu protein Com